MLTAFPQGAPVREQFSTMWREMVAFFLEHPAAFVFLELHSHTSYLDAESVAVDRGLKEFGAMMVRPAQEQGLLKQANPLLLMELVFGAFNGMMRAHWERRIELTPEVTTLAEQACWDTVAVHPPR